jgi:hypothetical protein
LRGFAPSRRSSEYNRNSAIAGLRTTNYDDSVYENMLYEDNIIVLKAEDGCTQARGIWTTNGKNDRQIVYRRNTVKVEAMPGNVKNTQGPYYNGDVNNAVTAVTFSGAELPIPQSCDENPDLCIENPTFYNQIPEPIIFEDNRLTGNVNLITIGEGYGITVSVWMYRTRLEKLDHDNEYFRPVRLGFWYWNTFNNRMIDTESVNFSADMMTPHFYGSTGYMEISYGQSHELTMMAGSQPLRNTSVTITIDGKRTFQGKTDNNGRLRFDLLTMQHLSYNGVKQTDYMQYTFTVAGYPSRSVTVSQLKTTTNIVF